MKNPAKTLKVLSILILIGSIFCIIGGVAALAGGSLITAVSVSDEGAAAINEDTEVASSVDAANEALDTELSGAEYAAAGGAVVVVAGIIWIIQGIWGIVMFAMGNKASKGGSAKGAFTVGIIAVVLAVINVISAVTNGSGIVSGIISIIFYGVYTYCAKQLKEQAA